MYKEPVKSMTFHSVWIWSTWRLIFLYIHTLINIIKIHYVSLFKWTLLKEIFLSLSVSKWFCSVVSDSDPMDCSLPGSSIHGIFKARVLEWVAIAFSRGSPWPRDGTQVSGIVGRRFTIWATREVYYYH